MNQEKSLLSDFLQRLKETTYFDKLVSIFYNDWSLNPYDDDDYSKRIGIKTAMLSKINLMSFNLTKYYGMTGTFSTLIP